MAERPVRLADATAPVESTQAAAPAKLSKSEIAAKPQAVPGEWEETFLEHYSQYGTITAAADAAGINYHAVHRRRQQDPEFERSYQDALVRFKDRLKMTAMTRALDGTNRPIYQRGVLVGVEKVYDNKLLTWLLERATPEEFFLPKKVEYSGPKGGPISFKFAMGEPGEEAIEEAEIVEPPALTEGGAEGSAEL